MLQSYYSDNFIISTSFILAFFVMQASTLHRFLSIDDFVPASLTTPYYSLKDDPGWHDALSIPLFIREPIVKCLLCASCYAYCRTYPLSFPFPYFRFFLLLLPRNLRMGFLLTTATASLLQKSLPPDITTLIFPPNVRHYSPLHPLSYGQFSASCHYCLRTSFHRHSWAMPYIMPCHCSPW